MLLDSSRWHSTTSHLQWKRKVTASRRSFYQLAPLALRTAGTEYGLFAITLPTPTASTGGSNGNAPAVTERGHGINLDGVLQTLPALIKTPTAQQMESRRPHGGSGSSGTLAQQMKYGTLPTPTTRSGTGAGLYGTSGPNLQTVLRDQIPTPTANGNHNRKGLSKTSQDGLATVIKDSLPTPDRSMAKSGYMGNRKQDGRQVNLPTALLDSTGGPNTGMKLQPEFVEWMMGMPPGWTDPESEVDIWSTAPPDAIEQRDSKRAETD